jgi:hypothetical protein
MSRERSYLDVCATDAGSQPSCLLYLLPAGQDRELVLTLHGPVPSSRDLGAWLQGRCVVTLTASREGLEGTFSVTVDFGHVLLARTTAPELPRHATF